MNTKNYWGYRIDDNHIEFFFNELKAGRLRQGWGYRKGQNLRNMRIDEGAGRNRSMLKVKKGDILLVPRLPNWDEVAVVEATEDWETGYHFEIDPDFKDYGHIFPAKFIKSFARSNENVLEALRTTLKNRQRFWNINHCAESVDALLATNAVLTTTQGWGARLESATEKVFNAIFKQTNFANKLFDELHRQFGSAEWEHALVYGLEQLFPTYTIERVGGPSEKDHGTDILIKIPGILPDFHYAIAIQVKDRDGFVSEDVIEQINRADKYWEENESIKLIDKIVIITKADKEENMHLPNNDSGVKFIFSDDLKALLSEIGKRIIGGKMINQSDV